MKLKSLIVGLTLFLLSSSAFATGSFKRKFLKQYPNAKGTVLGKCTLCHVKGDFSSKNSYGKDFGFNNFDFFAIENMDSDDDGSSNIEEIQALTLPGDAANKPE